MATLKTYRAKYETLHRIGRKARSALGVCASGPGLSYVHKLGFEIVRGCQLRCIGCPNSTLRPKVQRISVADFNTCLRSIDASRVNLLRLFNFGEPLLHNDLPGILMQIPKQRYPISTVEISTNAQFHDFGMMAETLKTGVLNVLAVSCDGDGTPEEYERLRPPARWSALLEFLSRTKELRDKYSPDLSLITRTICESEKGRERWTRLLARLGWAPEFRGWIYFPGTAHNPTGHHPSPAKNGICAFMHQGYLYVDWDGTVVPCCVYPRPFELGNLRTERASAIYRGRRRAEKLQQMRTNRNSMEVCGQCVF